MLRLNSLVSHPPPLREDEDGVIRVGVSRVTLQSILEYHRQGYTADDLHRAFPSVPLDEIYSVLAYYAWNREEMEQFLDDLAHDDKRAEEENRKRFPTDGLKQRLLDRAARQEKK